MNTKRRYQWPIVLAAFMSIGLSGCTHVILEYDRMTGTLFPADVTTDDGDTVSLGSIYETGKIALSVIEDDTGIAPLTGPTDPGDPDEYDYITDAELETLVAANRDSIIDSTSWVCFTFIFSFYCTHYHVYGVVVDHYRETDKGVRRTDSLGRMYDPTLRSGFVNFYKNSINRTENDKYLRSTAHELGHAFNLNHEDGDYSTTIMTKTSYVGDTFVYEFSKASLEHLKDHPKEYVWPGLGPRHYYDHSEHWP